MFIVPQIFSIFSINLYVSPLHCSSPFLKPTFYLLSFGAEQHGAKTINVFRACLSAQLTICAQK